MYFSFPLFPQPNDTDVSMPKFSLPLFPAVSFLFFFFFSDGFKVVILSSRCTLWNQFHTSDESDYTHSRHRKHADRKLAQAKHETIAGPRSRHVAHKLIHLHLDRHFILWFLCISWTVTHVRAWRLHGQSMCWKDVLVYTNMPFFSSHAQITLTQTPNNNFLSVSSVLGCGRVVSSSLWQICEYSCRKELDYWTVNQAQCCCPFAVWNHKSRHFERMCDRLLNWSVYYLAINVGRQKSLLSQLIGFSVSGFRTLSATWLTIMVLFWFLNSGVM